MLYTVNSQTFQLPFAHFHMRQLVFRQFRNIFGTKMFFAPKSSSKHLDIWSISSVMHAPVEENLWFSRLTYTVIRALAHELEVQYKSDKIAKIRFAVSYVYRYSFKPFHSKMPSYRNTVYLRQNINFRKNSFWDQCGAEVMSQMWRFSAVLLQRTISRYLQCW